MKIFKTLEPWGVFYPRLVKIGRVMKLTILFSLIVISQAIAISSYSQVTKLSLDMQNAKVIDVISRIEDESEFYFLYSSKLVDVEKSVSIKADNSDIHKILASVFKGTDTEFLVIERQIILSPKSMIKEYSEAVAQQQNVISGKVTDERENSLPGVTVAVKGKTQGTVTDVNGNYSLLNVQPKAVLVFSFVGMKTQEIEVGNRTTVNIVLQEETIGIEEVVAIGYGTQKKVNLTGSVSQVTFEEMKDRPITKMTQALQGVVPNLNIVLGSGQPGTSATLNIRGTTSINGGSPLVLIDGIPGNIDRINVNDVESVSVLKDASASAVYGARAAFGVILVTTKSAKDGKFQINYQNNFGWATHNTNTDFITTGYGSAKINEDAFYTWNASHLFRYSEEDWNELHARVNDKTENPDRPWVVVKQYGGKDIYNYYANFDWFNYFYSKYRSKQSHDLSISGASGNTQYLLSGNFSNEQGIFNIRPDYEDRYNFRAKVDSKVKKWLTISNNTNYFRSIYDWHGFNQSFTPSYDNLIGSDDPQFYSPYYHYHAQYVPFNSDGSLTGNSSMSNYTMGFGLHAIQEDGRSKGESSFSELSSTFQAIFNLTKDLTFTGNYSYIQNLFQRYYRSVKVLFSRYPGVLENWNWAALNTDQLTERVYTNNRHVINLFANYDRQLGKHSIKAMAGYNQELNQYKNIQASGTNLLSGTLNDLSLVTGTPPSVGGGATEYALRGIFGRFNYNYDGKYLFETSGRYDGTSRFPKVSRFGFFPSFSVGYRISEESFFEPLKSMVDNLKIRYSYGSLGNQDVSTYIYVSTMGTSYSGWLQNRVQVRQTTNPAPVASSLTWESATTNNVGLDIDILSNKLSLVADFYIRDTKNMLTQGKKLPAVFGASEPKENAADLRTQGFEVSLSWRSKLKVANKPLSYSLTAILADATSKITKFDNPSGLLDSYREGQKLGEIWGYKFDGFFKTTEEAQEYAKTVNMSQIARRGNSNPELGGSQAGDIKILDLNDDYIINGGAGTVESPGDRVIIGNTTPRYSYGFNALASWNGFDFYVLLQGIGKMDWYPKPETEMFWGPYSRPYASFIPSDFQNKVWSPENQNSYFPRLMGYLAANGELSKPNDMYLQNLAYCKLRNLTIGYTLPTSVLQKVNIDKLRIYLSGENMFTWTKLDTDYIDPEETMFNSDARTYPMGKTYSLGMELSF